MSIDFFNTRAGRKFYESDVPRIASALGTIATKLGQATEEQGEHVRVLREALGVVRHDLSIGDTAGADRNAKHALAYRPGGGSQPVAPTVGDFLALITTAHFDGSLDHATGRQALAGQLELLLARSS